MFRNVVFPSLNKREKNYKEIKSLTHRFNGGLFEIKNRPSSRRVVSKILSPYFKIIKSTHSQIVLKPHRL
jgi:hypothetical protein